MCDDMVIRRFAGVFVMASVALGWWVSPWWLLFTAFVGFNLLQSSFTKFCPLERVLGRFGLAGCTRR
ncbi:MAG: YgaP family membrane protein [Gemmatimonadaceae bacterium]